MRSQWNPDPDPKTGSWGPKPAARRGKVIAAAASVVAVILVAALVIALTTKDSGEPGGTAASDSAESADLADTAQYPADGEYQVKLEAADACLTIGPEPGNDERSVLVLGDCDKAYPKTLSFTKIHEHQYGVVLDLVKDHWRACMSLDPPGDDIGYLLSAQECDVDSQFQVFELSATAEDGFAIMVNGGLCLEPLEASLVDGTAVATATCSAKSQAQRFSFTDGP